MSDCSTGNNRTQVQISAPTWKTGTVVQACSNPSIEGGKDRQIQEVYWPASLAKQDSASKNKVEGNQGRFLRMVSDSLCTHMGTRT